MRAISNAMLWQMEVVQKNRWALGPLELVFLREPYRDTEDALSGTTLDPEKVSALHFDSMIFRWNQSASAGWVGANDVVDYLAVLHPRLIFVPQRAVAS